MNFSERYGYKSAKKMIQIDSMDLQLKNGLWNMLLIYCFQREASQSNNLLNSTNAELYSFCAQVWINYFNRPLDTMGIQKTTVVSEIRNHFFESIWYKSYDFVEFVAKNFSFYRKDAFIESCNDVLQKEMSAYRFVGDLITRITDNHEIDEIDQALLNQSNSVAIHIHRSLELLSDRNVPDYRNSIKEAVSAVESLVAKKLGKNGGTLGQLIKKLDTQIELHPALQSGFSSLYGFTSDSGGVRHAIMDKDNNDFHDAKFMLVACSAFINYVEGKSEY